MCPLAIQSGSQGERRLSFLANCSSLPSCHPSWSGNNQVSMEKPQSPSPGPTLCSSPQGPTATHMLRQDWELRLSRASRELLEVLTQNRIKVPLWTCPSSDPSPTLMLWLSLRNFRVAVPEPEVGRTVNWEGRVSLTHSTNSE